MRTSTKLKKLLENNTATFFLKEGKFEVIIVNNDTGNSHLCSGDNLSQVVDRALRDTNKASKKKDGNF
jgi:hypothetical protein